MMPKSAWIFWTCLLLAAAPALAQDGETTPRERVMPNQGQHARDLEARYRHQLPAGQFRLIPVGEEGMPALWIEQSTSAPQGGALIIHDDGQHPDWPRIVHDLRHHLPANGWSTLAITLPPRPSPSVPMRRHEADGPIPASAAGSEIDPGYIPGLMARIRAGERELNRHGLLNVVIIGVGTGALHATQYLVNERQNGATGGLGLVLIGARPNDTEAFGPLLSELRIPVLDLYPAEDRADAAARERRAALNRARIAELTQVKEQAWITARRSGPHPLTRRTWGWLRTNMAGMEREVEIVDVVP